MPKKKTTIIPTIEEVCYDVKLEFITPLCASVPADFSSVQYMLKTRANYFNKPFDVVMKEFMELYSTYEEVAKRRTVNLEEKEEEARAYSIYVFLRHPEIEDIDKGACLEDYHVKGLLDTALRCLGLARRFPNFRFTLRVEPRHILIAKDKECTKPAEIKFPFKIGMTGISGAGTYVRFLTFSEYIEPPAYAKFKLYVIKKYADIIPTLFEYGEKYLGFLKGRRHECGKFKVIELKKCENNE